MTRNDLTEDSGGRSPAPGETTALSSRFAGFCFAILLLLSGFCGISYEILYGRILGNLIGDQFAVSASILLTFLLGIGFGTLWAHRLWRFLWLIEAGIGTCGVGFALGSGVLDRWLYSAGPVLGTGLGGSILASLLLLCLPTFLIGCSLPLFAGYLVRFSAGQVFAKAYTVYNFGAALTALLIEFWLLRRLGIRNATLAIAALNFIVSMALLLGFGRSRELKPATEERVRFPRQHLLALACASVASAVFQLLMVKIAECLLGPFRETFALVLAIVLFGIAFGSALTARFRVGFRHLMLLCLLGLAWLMGGFGWVGKTFASLHAGAADSYGLAVLLRLAVTGVLMGLPALAFGATIPALLKDRRDVARESGQLLFVSSIANAFGFLIMAFFLHRYFDYGTLILIVAGVTGLSLIVHLGFRPLAWAGVAVLVLSVGGLQRALWNEGLLYMGHTAYRSTLALDTARSQAESRDTFKGYQDVFSINWSDGHPYFFINGYISFPLKSISERLVGAFASLFVPRTDRALVLGLGSGATGGTVARLFDRTDAVEISRVVLENLHRMAPYNFDLEKAPGMRIILDDAIHFTKTSRETYSLILNTVTSPIYFSSSKLYTRDFLEMAHQRLTPDGVYVTWIDSRVGDEGLEIILRTVSRSFKECAIGHIKLGYFLLICSDEPIKLHQADRIAANPILVDFFYHRHGFRPDWIAYGLATTNAGSLVLDPAGPVNTMDFPSLEFAMTRVRRNNIEQFRKRLDDRLSLDDVARALAPAMEVNPLHLALHNEMLLKDSKTSERWKEVASRAVPDFESAYTREKLAYHAGYAASFDTAKAHHAYGRQLRRMGRCAQAIDEFRKALVLDPQKKMAHYNIARCNETMGRREDALGEYLEERRINPKDDDVHARLGRLYYRLGRYDEALASLDVALSMVPQSGAYLDRARVHEALGAVEDAKRDLREALRLNPGDHVARKALARLEPSAP